MATRQQGCCCFAPYFSVTCNALCSIIKITVILASLLTGLELSLGAHFVRILHPYTHTYVHDRE